MAQSWYNAILAGTANLVPRVKEELRTKQPGMDVKHVGWITEQVWRDEGFMLPAVFLLKDNVSSGNLLTYLLIKTIVLLLY